MLKPYGNYMFNRQLTVNGGCILPRCFNGPLMTFNGAPKQIIWRKKLYV